MVAPTPGRRAQSAGAGRGRASPASTRSTASAAPRRSRRWLTAPATIAPVDKIVGPGNAYVAEAKRQVFGRVGIDMIAGPSESLVVADAGDDPAWIAADLLAQAEHDERAQSILITDDAGFADARSRGGRARSWRRCRAANAGGELARPRRGHPGPLARAAPGARRPLGAGASRAGGGGSGGAAAPRSAMPAPIFLGRYTPEVDRRLCRRPQPRAADGAHARASLGPSVLRLPEAHDDPGLRPSQLRARWRRGRVLARAEGLEAHALAVERRLGAGGAER